MEEPTSLAGYAARIGAIRKSLRRYIIREELDDTGYSRDKYVIAVAADGGITVRSRTGKAPDEHDPVLPTDAELGAIKAEVALLAGQKKWPMSQAANETWLDVLREKLKKASGHEPELFVFRGRNEGEILFVQERVFDRNGDKTDLPWSFWTDHEWRCMEPDHLEAGLPLFGLDQLKDTIRVYVHEGAKGAYHVGCMAVGRRVTYAIDKVLEKHAHLQKCPWREELSRPGAAHVGWPGGGPNAWRVDWSPIAALPPHVDVIVVCDHDAVGEEAASTISRLLKRTMSALRFDDNFPPGFDLADEWPDKMEWWPEGGRYVGPQLGQMLEPATWATDVKPNPNGQGRPTMELRKEFAREWLRSKEPSVFVHRNYCDKLYSPESFNSAVRPFSDAEDTARLLTRSFQAQVDGVQYRPTRKRAARRAEVVNEDGARLVNTFRPSSIVAAEGEDAPWIQYMEHLIPEERDRYETMRWCATLIDRVDVKMLYGLLLLSDVQGIGKTTLGEILAVLVGPWNASFPSEQELVNSNYNSWIAHKRLAVCNEIYTGSSRKAYDRLKSIITDRTIEVQRKYMETYKIENHVHILACSNSMHALYIDNNDRRWLIPRVTEEKKPQTYWEQFYAWLNGGGYGIIAHWAAAFLKKHPAVATGAPAPMSAKKAEVIEESRSPGAAIAYELACAAVSREAKTVLSLDDVRGFVAGRRKMDLDDSRLEKPLTLRKAMRDAGMKEPDRRDGEAGVPRFQIKTGENKSYVLATFAITPQMEWADLQQHLIPATDLLKM